jgi:hypothetical protein
LLERDVSVLVSIKLFEDENKVFLERFEADEVAGLSNQRNELL